MNHYTSTSPNSWFTNAVVCVKWHLSDDGEKIVGQTTLFGNTLKRRIENRIELEIELKSEGERVEAIDKYLGIPLGEGERTGIAGMQSALP